MLAIPLSAPVAALDEFNSALSGCVDGAPAQRAVSGGNQVLSSSEHGVPRAPANAETTEEPLVLSLSQRSTKLMRNPAHLKDNLMQGIVTTGAVSWGETTALDLQSAAGDSMRATLREGSSLTSGSGSGANTRAVSEVVTLGSGTLRIEGVDESDGAAMQVQVAGCAILPQEDRLAYLGVNSEGSSAGVRFNAPSRDTWRDAEAQRFIDSLGPEVAWQFVDADGRWDGDSTGGSPPESSEIRFYHRDECFFRFTNFSDDPVTIGLHQYRTCEHGFQALKFVDRPELMQKIRENGTAREALVMANSPSFKKFIHPYWHKGMKIGAMLQVLRSKFSAGSELATLLLSTGDARLVENAPNDRYWGGASGGQNWLGRCLMKVRCELGSVPRASPVMEQEMLGLGRSIACSSHDGPRTTEPEQSNWKAAPQQPRQGSSWGCNSRERRTPEAAARTTTPRIDAGIIRATLRSRSHAANKRMRRELASVPRASPVMKQGMLGLGRSSACSSHEGPKTTQP